MTPLSRRLWRAGFVVGVVGTGVIVGLVWVVYVLKHGAM